MQNTTALLGASEVADRLGVSVKTVRRLVAAGELTAVRLGYRTLRFRAEDVAALVNARTEAAS